MSEQEAWEQMGAGIVSAWDLYVAAVQKFMDGIGEAMAPVVSDDH